MIRKSDFMQKVFLVSSLDCNYKIDGVRYPKKINNINGIVEQIQSNLSGNHKIVFFASAPECYDLTDNYSNIIFQGFQKSGIHFENVVIIDERFQGDLESEVKSADLIFLLGGDPDIQIEYFKRFGLKELLNNYSGVIVGQSAGAMNLAEIVLCSPEYEEQIGQNYKWEGLGKTKINIEPHFILNVTEELDTKLRTELLRISNEGSLYAIPDGSHIFDNGETIVIFGEAYLIENGNVVKINDNHQQLDITKKTSKKL